jgi:hypothetical protein
VIDIHHLVYAGVILLFLAGSAIIALAALFSLGITAITAWLIRLIKAREAVTRATADTGALLLRGLLDAFHETAHRHDIELEPCLVGRHMSARDDAGPSGQRFSRHDSMTAGLGESAGNGLPMPRPGTPPPLT